MSTGTRQQPEKNLDRQFCPKSAARRSRKSLKQAQNRRDRHLANLDPETPPRPKYKGWEW